MSSYAVYNPINVRLSSKPSASVIQALISSEDTHFPPCQIPPEENSASEINNASAHKSCSTTIIDYPETSHPEIALYPGRKAEAGNNLLSGRTP